MTEIEKAETFHALHSKSSPLVLFNIWDAGGAISAQAAGANAVATSSWSMAAAHGFPDGEAMPLDFMLKIVSRIAQSIELPLTVDFEGGYAETPEHVAANVMQVISAGAIGINFEDQIVNGTGLYPITQQVARIKAIRLAANDRKIPFFINARTDLFLKTDSVQSHQHLIAEALDRQVAYAEAGADGFFIPGLTDQNLIRDLCKASLLPINVMITDTTNPVHDVAQLGVSRISFGPLPYLNAIQRLKENYSRMIR